MGVPESMKYQVLRPNIFYMGGWFEDSWGGWLVVVVVGR